MLFASPCTITAGGADAPFQFRTCTCSTAPGGTCKFIVANTLDPCAFTRATITLDPCAAAPDTCSCPSLSMPTTIEPPADVFICATVASVATPSCSVVTFTVSRDPIAGVSTTPAPLATIDMRDEFNFCAISPSIASA